MTAFTCPPDHSHGLTSNCYTGHACRCADCRELARERRYWARHMLAAGRLTPGSLLDARGVRRRLEALMALGWSMPLIAERIGVDRSLVLIWLRAQSVQLVTIERVAAAYDELCMLRPPVDSRARLGVANRTRRVAAARGYVPPLAWDDIDEDDAPATAPETIEPDVVAIELAITGAARVKLTTAERHEAVRALNGRGYWDREIARMLSVDEKTIGRDREALGLPAVDHVTHAEHAARGTLVHPVPPAHTAQKALAA